MNKLEKITTAVFAFGAISSSAGCLAGMGEILTERIYPSTRQISEKENILSTPVKYTIGLGTTAFYLGLFTLSFLRNSKQKNNPANTDNYK